MANGRIELTWGDGEHVFNIAKLAQVFELEDKCGCGVNEVFNRLREGRWKFNDVREPIRLGLIGGGKNPAEALLLTKRYVDERPWAESILTAQMILMAAIVGVEGDNPAKKTDADRAADSGSTTMTAGSSDPQSTASGPGLAGDPGKLETQPSGNSPPASKATTGPTASKTSRTHPRQPSSTVSSNVTPQS